MSEKKDIKPVIVIEKSKNKKIGLAGATYAPIHSCPNSCPFIDEGCYAKLGYCGIQLNRINKAATAQGVTRPVDIAQAEAQEIQKLSGLYPLRLHVVGDCRTVPAVKVLAGACREFSSKRGQPVWTYTHSWKIIPREAWGDISVLASCESVDQVKEAYQRGYASMIVTEPFSKSYEEEGFWFIACKESVKQIPCSVCKLCLNDKKLYRQKKVVCVFPHGSQASKVSEYIAKLK